MEEDLGEEFMIGILVLELRSCSDIWKCKMGTGSFVYSIKMEETNCSHFEENSPLGQSFTGVM